MSSLSFMIEELSRKKMMKMHMLHLVHLKLSKMRTFLKTWWTDVMSAMMEFQHLQLSTSIVVLERYQLESNSRFYSLFRTQVHPIILKSWKSKVQLWEYKSKKDKDQRLKKHFSFKKQFLNLVQRNKSASSLLSE